MSRLLFLALVVPLSAQADELTDLIAKGLDEGLTSEEYYRMVELRPEEQGGWWKNFDTGIWTAKSSNTEVREWFGEQHEKATEEHIDQEREDAEERNRDIAEFMESHDGGDHDPCECFELKAHALNEDGAKRTDIISTSSATPTRLPWTATGDIYGWADARDGLHTWPDGETCCTSTHEQGAWVQVHISTPAGRGMPAFDLQPYDPDNTDNWIEDNETRALLTWTPWNFRMEFLTGGGLQNGDGVLVEEARKGQKVHRHVGIETGLGKVDLWVGEQLCDEQTLYYWSP